MPNFTFVVQHLVSTSETHQKEITRILIYLKKSIVKGILFSRTSFLQLGGFSDSDWGTYKDTRRSTSDNCFFTGDSLISLEDKETSNSGQIIIQSKI